MSKIRGDSRTMNSILEPPPTLTSIPRNSESGICFQENSDFAHHPNLNTGCAANWIGNDGSQPVGWQNWKKFIQHTTNLAPILGPSHSCVSHQPPFGHRLLPTSLIPVVALLHDTLWNFWTILHLSGMISLLLSFSFVFLDELPFILKTTDDASAIQHAWIIDAVETNTSMSLLWVNECVAPVIASENSREVTELRAAARPANTSALGHHFFFLSYIGTK